MSQPPKLRPSTFFKLRHLNKRHNENQTLGSYDTNYAQRGSTPRSPNADEHNGSWNRWTEVAGISGEPCQRDRILLSLFPKFPSVLSCSTMGKFPGFPKRLSLGQQKQANGAIADVSAAHAVLSVFFLPSVHASFSTPAIALAGSRSSGPPR